MDDTNKLIMNGFMDHGDGGRSRYPGSRDFMLDQSVCAATRCICNSGGRCFAPSRAGIDKDGRCKNFKPKQICSPYIQGL